MDSYSSEPAGLLLIADGLSPVRIWDGLTAGTEEAGTAPPLTAATIAILDTPGDIIGEFTAYVRFRDRRGNYSDLSPISNTLTAQSATTKAVSAATNATPIVITTTTNHGLSTGNVVDIVGVLGNEAANDRWTVTVTGLATFELDDSAGTAAYTSGGTVTIAVSQINYSAVPIATGIGASKVVARELLRNTDGQATTFYIDATISDNVTTTASSTKNDDELSAETAVPLLEPDGSLSANRYGVPPNFMKVLAHHSGRMFYLVNAEEKRGACIVTNASTTVTGINTLWTDALVGRALYVTGATESYTISAVSEADQTLTLSEAYGDSTDGYALYSIKPQPAQRRLIYYSEAGLVEAVPAINAIELQDTGDELVAAMTKGSFVYFIEMRDIYRFTFRANPGIDGFAFLTADRGAINHRCIVKVDDGAYMLDQSGVHFFTGASETQPVSDAIQGLFSAENDSPYGLKINWAASDLFHGAHYPAEKTIRFFVCLSGQYLPRHAITFDYGDKSWWLEEYPSPVSASCTGTVAGQRRLFFGSEGKKVLLHGAAQLDGIDHNAGTLRGTATSASQFRLVDLTASFPTADLPGLFATIAEGKGRGQTRQIHSATTTILKLTTPWLVLPDDTSVYQIAGVSWVWRSKWFRLVNMDESEEGRGVAVQFEPLDDDSPSPAAGRVFYDYSEDAHIWGYTKDAEHGEGFGSVEGNEFLTLDLTKTNGYAQQRLDDNKEVNVDGHRQVSVELSGVSHVDKPVIYQINLDGVE